MTVSEYIFAFLEKKGLKKVYMVSGSSAMWLTDALYKNERIEAICCHHEQAAAMAADGYGRVNNIPGACLVTIGPGATNAITGVAQAYLDSSPMFVISGQANSQMLQDQITYGIRQKGTQSLNLEPLVSSITKYFAVITNANDIKYHMENAYKAAVEGRKGPVWIDVPVNIQNAQISIDEDNDVEEVDIKQNCTIDYEDILRKIQASKKPLILAGAGIRNAGCERELIEFCNKQVIPVVVSRGGIDIIESNLKIFVGRPGAYGDRASHFAIQQCDFLMILGSRLSASTIGYYPARLAPNAYKIWVDIDNAELNRKEINIDKKYCEDLKVFIRNLDNKKAGNSIDAHNIWLEYCNRLKKKYPNVKDEYQYESPLNEYYVTSVISDNVKEDAIIVVDTGSVCNIVSQSWKIKNRQRYLISGGLSCMGFWATSLGAYVAGRPLIAIAGDGSTQMNIQELATIKYNNIPLKLFIYNNNGYMLIRHNQHNYMEDRYLGVGPDSGVRTPSFSEVAKAYGIKSYLIINRESLVELVPIILELDEPVVIEIMVQEFAPIVPRIASRVMPDGSLKAAEFDDLFPFLSSEEYNSSIFQG